MAERRGVALRVWVAAGFLRQLPRVAFPQARQGAADPVSKAHLLPGVARAVAPSALQQVVAHLEPLDAQQSVQPELPLRDAAPLARRVAQALPAPQDESESLASARSVQAQQDVPQPELQDVAPQAQPVSPQRSAEQTPPQPLELRRSAVQPVVQQEAHPALPVSLTEAPQPDPPRDAVQQEPRPAVRRA